jgi:hypothetical protein
MASDLQQHQSAAQRHSRLAVKVMAIIILIGAVSMTYLIHRSSQQLIASLDSPDPDTVTYSLLILKQRRDPAGIAKADTLLQSPSTDVQTNAATYLGAMGKSESIPYLINALKTVDESDAHEISVDLTMMTGVDFGGRYDPWNHWWQSKHPATTQ